MRCMFHYCSSLSAFPDISKWKTNKVYHMSDMFNRCSSLSSLPDISKWNTNKTRYMDWMFYRCLNIITSKVINSKYKS